MPTRDLPDPVDVPDDLVITEVRIQPQNTPTLKAFAAITLNGSFVVRGLKVIQSSEGRFVAMPARKRGDGTFQDIAHPIHRRFREYMESVILRAYSAELGERETESSY